MGRGPDGAAPPRRDFDTLRKIHMLPAIWLVVALSGSISAELSAPRQAPSYSAASIVNAASNSPNSFAPNTFVSIYGTNLAFTTRALQADDLIADTLPTVLPGTGVRVWVGNVPAHVYYVSPQQINILLPADMNPGKTQIRVQVDSTFGPQVQMTLGGAAPALFQLDATTAIAAHVDGSVATDEAPAHPGEWVILYATGLGLTIPGAGYGEIPTTAAVLQNMSAFGVTLNGEKIPADRIAYAGVAPGFAGLYQVNLRLPDNTPPDPEVRLISGGTASPPGVRLPVRP